MLVGWGSRRGLVLSCALLCVLVALFFHRSVFSYRLFFFYDTIMQNFPFGLYFAEGFSNFRLRLWCPEIFSGFPLMAEGQAGPLYPLFAPLLLVAPYWVIYKFSIVLHSLLAGLSMLLLLRQMRLRVQSCLYGAVVFAFSGYFAAQVSHANIIRGYCYLPALLAGCEAIRRDGFRRLWVVAVLLGAMLLGTHPYIAIYSLLALGLWLLFGLAGVRPRRAQISRFALIAAALALGVGISAAQLLPSAELFQRSVRGVKPSWEFVTAGSLAPRNLIGFVLPDFFGTPANNSYWGRGEIGLFFEFCGYVGVLSLLLTIVAALFVRDRRLSYYWVVLVAALLLALGRHTPVYRLAAKLPIISATRTPARYLYLVVFALSVLSAFGLEHILSAGQRQKRRLVSIVVLAAAVALCGTALWLALPNLRVVRLEHSQPAGLRSLVDPELSASFGAYADVLREDLVRALVIVAASVVLLLLLVNRAGTRRYIAILLSIVAFCDLYWFGNKLNPVVEPGVYTDLPPVARFLKMDGEMFRTIRWRVKELWRPAPALRSTKRRADPFTPGWLGDVAKYEDCTSSIVPNTNLLYAIDMADGYTSFSLARYNAALGAPGLCAWPRFEPTRGLLALFNVKYVISSRQISQDWLSPVFIDRDIIVYRNRSYLPRFCLIEGTIILPNETDVVEAVRSPGFDPAKGVIVSRDEISRSCGLEHPLKFSPLVSAIGAQQAAVRAGGAPGRVRLVECSADRVRLAVSAKRPCWLVVSENYYPGWKAFVNRRRVPIVKAYGLVKAIPLAAGRYDLTLCFEPDSFRLGLVVSLLCVMATTFVGFVSKGRGPRGTIEGAWLGQSRPILRVGLTVLIFIVVLLFPGRAAAPGQKHLSAVRFAGRVAEAYCDAGLRLLRRGDPLAARDALAFASTIAPRRLRAHWLYGVCLFKLGRREAARQQWERCLMIDPSFSPAVQGLRALGRGVRGQEVPDSR